MQAIIRSSSPISYKSRDVCRWVDGALARAIAHGGWVLLDNANLCNPTVLDRLNPLLEPGGGYKGGGWLAKWWLSFWSQLEGG